MYEMKWSSATASLPPGFRFHPTDEELIIHYLKQKVSPSSSHIISIIADVNIYKFNPWELPDKAYFGENEWFFFSPRDKKYPNGRRPNRAAGSGYWKATGTDKPIIESVGSQCLGMKKSLVFYIGRPPKGVKSDWTMTEYRLLDDYFPSRRPEGSMRLDDWVLCRVQQKSKVPQQIGGRNYDSSCSCSPPFSRGYLQGQETMIIDQLPAPADDQYHQVALLESEELMEEKGFQELGSPENSLSTDDLTSNSQTTTNDSNVGLGDVLISIERVLSVGALDELLPIITSTTTTTTRENIEDCFQFK